MKKVSFAGLTSAVALISAVLIAPTVSAQSGSRLCGWTATMPAGTVLSGKTLPFGGKIGLLYECRDGDASYHKQCDEAIDGFNKAIQSDPTMKGFVWTQVKRATCESVGGEFTSTANSSTDMCDSMEAKHAYSVIKPYNSASKTAAATSYTKS